jgi:Holliday junction DNA helicase RuvA
VLSFGGGSMIASLRGKVSAKGTNRVIIDVGGVGYDVFVSFTSLESLEQDADTFLYIYTSVRENSLELFGFVTLEEKTLFELLLGVAGVGPKTSLQILSGISPQGFREAVLGEDEKRLTSIPGIGKKSAQRIILELKEKIKKRSGTKMSSGFALTSGSIEQDLVSSLVNLGFKEKTAEEVVRGIMKTAPKEITFSEGIKKALKELMPN